MGFWKISGIAAGSALALIVGVRLLNPLPDHQPPAPTTFPDRSETALARAIAPQAEAHPGRSGVVPLANALEAFAARELLARAAERTLDVQYYIWHRDKTGTLMLGEMLRAAERGVRVRILVDDNGIGGMDDALAALDSHPNAEVRIFNPFTIRRAKPLLYVTDFSRLNRRMHNKSFTADGIATIVGGRNIGDEYFGAQEGDLFADLDVLAVGPIAGSVEADFERYWQSASAYPAADILRAPPEDGVARLRAEAAETERSEGARAYVRAVSETELVSDLLSGDLALEWAEVAMVSDDPAKGLGKAPPGGTLAERLGAILENPERSVRIVSGYFVPGREGAEELARLARSGIEVSVLTNGLATTDVAIVHSGYEHRRRALLEAGVRLFEMKPDEDASRERLHLFRRGSTLAGSGSGSGPVFRGSGASLHAKTFAKDGKRIFIGSFNFDPRSFDLNTEIGFIIDSEALATRLERAFEEDVPGRAYEVRLGEGGRMEWLQTLDDDRRAVLTTEPHTTPVTRGIVRVLSWLPIEWLL
jgi:putative cardiolipin synthase